MAGDEAVAAAECAALVESVIRKFPSARGDIATMAKALVGGDSLSLHTVEDLPSRLALTKACKTLRFTATSTAAGTAFEKGRDTLPEKWLRRAFACVWPVSEPEEEEGGRRAARRSKKEEKKERKREKKERKRLRKERKRKRAAAGSSSSSGSDTSGSGRRRAGRPAAIGGSPGAAAADPAPARRVIGPAPPPASHRPAQPAQPAPESDDDSFGPSVPYSAVQEARGYDSGDEHVAVPSERARAGQKKQRDAWMTSIPEGETALGSIGWRGKRHTGGGSEAAKREWLATPAERAAMQTEEGKAALGKEQAVRDAAEAHRQRQLDARNDAARAEFERLMPEARRRRLADVHAEQQPRDEPGRGPAEWNRDEEFALDGTVDTTRLRRNVANAKADLSKRFGHGGQHFLGGGL